MTTTTRQHPTLRQSRLLAFLAHQPSDDPLIEWGERSWTYRMWTAQEIVDRTHIYEGPGARNACLRDLNRLVALGELSKFGNDASTRFTIGEGFRL